MTDFDAAFSSGNVLKFPDIGDSYTFTVTDLTQEDRINLNGQEETVLVIHGLDDTGDAVRLFCNKNQMKYAIGNAVQTATGKPGAPKPGGKLSIKRTEDGPVKKAGYSAPHGYAAKYEAPDPAAAIDAAFGNTEPF